MQMAPDAIAECVGEVLRIGDTFPNGSTVDNLPTWAVSQTVKACREKRIPAYHAGYHIVTAKTHSQLLGFLKKHEYL